MTRFVLLTAAKDEERYIGETIESVLRQTLRPSAWIIVDDASTDGTARIVQRFAQTHGFIRLHTRRSAGTRSFGAQYRALIRAYELARHLDFAFIGTHDADVAPESSDYYERILAEFDANPRLGLAGGYIMERSHGRWACRHGNSPDSVAGGIQMFRRECYEAIGGYAPLRFGGEDWAAQLEARMCGWETRAFPQYRVCHYRPTSSAGGRIRGLFRLGLLDASLGTGFAFELFKCARRCPEKPALLGSIVRLGGYAAWKLSGRTPLLGEEQVAFLRTEQRAKLRSWWRHQGDRLRFPMSSDR
jgi:hypothetical protein